MDLQIISDLHIDAESYEHIPAAEILMVAGDISNKMQRSLSFLNGISKDHTLVLAVMGNHDYYSGRASTDAFDSLASNVVVLNGDSFAISDKIIVHGYTWWTDFGDSLECMKEAYDTLSDFRLIKDPADGDTVSPLGMRRWHKKDKNDLKHAALKHQDMTQIVLTHFAPVQESIHPKYEGNPLNGYFCNKDDDALKGISVWIHGHTHSSFDYVKDGTRVVCNPKGYGNENPEYDYTKVISV